MVMVGHGFAADQLGQGIHSRIPVKIHGSVIGCGLRLGGEAEGADQHHGDKGKKQGQNQVNHHITALLSYKGSGQPRW